MKNYLTLLIIAFLSQNAFCYEKVYLQEQNPNKIIYQKVYNSNINRYYYKKNQLKKYRNLKRIKRNIYNLYRLSFDFNKNNSGSLTGYSMPISSDDYNKIFKDNSSNLNTELFSSPTKNYDINSTNGNKNQYDATTGSKTGVTIIYD